MSTSRRNVLRLLGAAAVTVGTAGVSGVASGQAEPNFGGWFEDVDNYDGIVDGRGQDSATVDVGTKGNGGPFGYRPAAIRVDPGTTVSFEWASDNHNLAVERQPDGGNWRGHDPIEERGFTFVTTFTGVGVYLYVCQPHRALGMKGAIVVGDVTPALGDETGDPGTAGQTKARPAVGKSTESGGSPNSIPDVDLDRDTALLAGVIGLVDLGVLGYWYRTRSGE